LSIAFEFCVLGSGSDGNSVAFWDSESLFLIDAGFSCREIGRRLDEIGKEAGELQGILISHEHVDHARGARVMKKRHGLKVYSTATTYEWLVHRYDSQTVQEIEPETKFNIGKFTVQPFEVPHDASQTVGFIIKQGRKKVTLATDLGHMSAKVRNKFKNSDAIVLESNHDVQMLKEGPYPKFLKQRILGMNGHLSNIESANTLASVISDKTKHITLAHLSRENNKPEVALEEVKKILSTSKRKPLSIVPASQFEVGEIVEV